MRIQLQKFTKPFVGLDLGGSLIKTVFSHPNLPSLDSSITRMHENIPLYCAHLPSTQLDQLISFLNKLDLLSSENSHIFVTGGGAYKHQAYLKVSWNQSQKKIGISITKLNEIHSVGKGFKEVISWTPALIQQKLEDRSFGPVEQPISIEQELPILLVVAGSGVSFIRIDSSWDSQRVSGSMVGGGTLMGLSRLLFNISNFQELVSLASQGSHTHVDLLVGDVYGKGGSNLKNLEGDIIAASLAKAKLGLNPFDSDQQRQDIADSLLTLIGVNIGQLAVMEARLQNISKVYFSGNLVRPSLYSHLQLGLDFFGEGNCEARYVKSGGFLGALGAYITGVEKELRQI